MENNLTAIKAAMAAFFTAITAFLGWKGIMAIVWFACMALDYISGTAAACKAGDWNSPRAREGLWHKLGMIIAVVVAAIADGILALACANMPIGIDWPELLLPLVLAWYIITELGSILENVIRLGAVVPDWLVQLLKASLHAVDNVGDSTIPEHDPAAIDAEYE